jgi:tetratricopeptide (TPR) repeat protein
MKKVIIQGCCAAGLAVLALTGCTSAEEKWAQQLAAGRQFSESKDYARAILSFRNAVQLKPDHPQAYYEMALANMKAGDAAASVSHLRKVLEIDPKHEGASLRLAEVMAGTDERSVVEDAEQRLKAILSASPANVEALTALAIAEWKLAKAGDAEEHLHEAFRRAPNDLTSSVSLAKMKAQRKDYDGAEQILRKAAEHKPVSPNSLIALGEFLLFRNRPAEAEALFREALQIDPQHALALLHTAAIQVRRGDMTNAGQTYKRVSELPEKQYRPIYGIFLLQTGRREDAIGVFNALIKKDPRDRASRSALVAALVEGGKVSEAEGILNEALSKNPKDNQALLQRSALYLSRWRTEDAYRDLNVLLQFRSDSPEAHYLLSKVHEQRSSPYHQRQELVEVLRLNPAFLQARVELSMLFIRTNGARAALQALNEAPETQQQSLAIVTQRNWALLALGKKDEARRLLEATLPKSQTSDLLVQDALLKLESGQTTHAKAALHDVLARDPGDVRALEVMASVYRAENQAEAGWNVISSYVKKKPHSAAAQYFHGTLLLRAGKLKEAREAFEASTVNDVTFTMGNLGVASVSAAEGKWADARSRLQIVIEKTGDNAQARYWLGNVEQKLENPAAALEHYRKLLTLDPDHVAGLNNVAFLLAGNDETCDEALKYAQKARELAPGNPAIENTLGWVLYRKGLYSMAIPHLERAVRSGATPRRQCHLGMAYVKAGDVRRGRQMLDTALRSDQVIPEALDAKTLLAQIN